MGPLRIRDDAGASIDLPQGRLRTLVAALLVQANAVVSAEALVEQIWDSLPPKQPREALQVMMVRLRKHLGPGPAARVRAVRAGYAIETRPGELDLHRFEELCRRGADACARQDWGTGGAVLAQALDLWRGRPLEGIPADRLTETVVHGLEERRIRALSDRITADLALGRHARLLGELTEVVGLHPLHEGFRGQLILGLHRSGRTADALECYREGRRILVRELGLEPGVALTELHQAILSGTLPAFGGTDPGAGSPPPAPCQLPDAVADFVGRSESLAQISAHLLRPAPDEVVPVMVLSGAGGVGKSALAVHAAHRLRAEFPDGQVFVPLSTGGRERPVEDVLSELITSVAGRETALPEKPAARVALWRRVSSGRRLLLVLDDARSTAQVRRLLPGPGGGAVLVTSRNRMPGLTGRRLLEVATLPRDASVALLRHAIGDARADAEPEELVELAEQCADLPLALRISGARLSARNTWTVRSFLRGLREARLRLDEFSTGDRTVRGTIESSLPEAGAPSLSGVDVRAAFAHLGLIGGAPFGTGAVAAVLDISARQAEDVVEQFVDLHLLAMAGPGRFGFHDLVLEVAREHAGSRLDAGTRTAALGRWVGWAAGTAWHAERLTNARRRPTAFEQDWIRHAEWQPGAAEDAESAWAWFDLEWQALLAAARAGAAAGLHEPLAVLSLAAAYPGRLRCWWRETEELTRLGLAAAHAVGDTEVRIAATNDHAISLAVQQRFDAALPVFAQAMALARTSGDRLRESQAGLNTAIAARHRDLPEQALAVLDEATKALDEHERSTEPTAMSRRIRRSIMLCQGISLSAVGRHGPALELLNRLLSLAEAAQDVPHLNQTRLHLGRLHVARSHPSEALPHLEAALAGFEAMADPEATASALHALGRAELALGRTAEALGALRRAHTLFSDLDHQEAEQVLELIRQNEEATVGC
ncbi:NB-ARC domain-containing protein [Kitasatospora sp. NBC_00070]|uniref:AfsR/SARP family transcriptional regulator n=1 Tax=Kitasatospora sp. NBC_00070 TaxID=2975962 RepID=UPI0032440DC7